MYLTIYNNTKSYGFKYSIKQSKYYLTILYLNLKFYRILRELTNKFHISTVISSKFLPRYLNNNNNW